MSVDLIWHVPDLLLAALTLALARRLWRVALEAASLVITSNRSQLY